MEEKGFENADIVFITDGECVLPPEFISRLQEEQVRRRFTITGVLLDQGNEGMDFSLGGRKNRCSTCHDQYCIGFCYKNKICLFSNIICAVFIKSP